MITESFARPQGGVQTLQGWGFLVIKTLPSPSRKETKHFRVQRMPEPVQGSVGRHDTFALHDDVASGDSCPCFLSRASYLLHLGCGCKLEGGVLPKVGAYRVVLLAPWQ